MFCPSYKFFVKCFPISLISCPGHNLVIFSSIDIAFYCAYLRVGLEGIFNCQFIAVVLSTLNLSGDTFESLCSSLHLYFCSQCQQGLTGNGTCVCDPNFSGKACDRCFDDKHFGPNCTSGMCICYLDFMHMYVFK